MRRQTENPFRGGTKRSANVFRGRLHRDWSRVRPWPPSICYCARPADAAAFFAYEAKSLPAETSRINAAISGELPFTPRCQCAVRAHLHGRSRRLDDASAAQSGEPMLRSCDKCSLAFAVGAPAQHVAETWPRGRARRRATVHGPVASRRRFPRVSPRRGHRTRSGGVVAPSRQKPSGFRRRTSRAVPHHRSR